MRELRRVLFSKAAVCTLFVSLVLTGVMFWQQAQSVCNGDVFYYKEIYLSTIEECRAKAYEDALFDIDERIYFLSAQLDYDVLCLEDNNPQIEIFCEMYGEELFHDLSERGEISEDKLKKIRVEIKAVYDSLFHSKNMSSSFWSVFFLVLLIAGLVSTEHQHGTKLLIKTTLCGRKKIFIIKLLTAFFFSTVVFVVVYLTELILTIQSFGALHALSAPLSSLTNLYVDSQISILVWILFIYLKRLLILWAITSVTLFISSLCKNSNSALLSCIIIFILPSILYMIGVDALAIISPIRYMTSCRGINICSCIVCVALCAVFSWLTYLLWNRTFIFKFAK